MSRPSCRLPLQNIWPLYTVLGVPSLLQRCVNIIQPVKILLLPTIHIFPTSVPHLSSLHRSNPSLHELGEAAEKVAQVYKNTIHRPWLVKTIAIDWLSQEQLLCLALDADSTISWCMVYHISRNNLSGPDSAVKTLLDELNN